MISWSPRVPGECWAGVRTPGGQGHQVHVPLLHGWRAPGIRWLRLLLLAPHSLYQVGDTKAEKLIHDIFCAVTRGWSWLESSWTTLTSRRPGACGGRTLQWRSSLISADTSVQYKSNDIQVCLTLGWSSVVFSLGFLKDLVILCSCDFRTGVYTLAPPAAPPSPDTAFPQQHLEHSWKH